MWFKSTDALNYLHGFLGGSWFAYPLSIDGRCCLIWQQCFRGISPSFISLVLKGGSFPSHLGTSGDTGSAAIESVRGAKNVGIIVLLPQGHCTKIQERQMTTVLEENVHVFGGECWDGL